MIEVDKEFDGAERNSSAWRIWVGQKNGVLQRCFDGGLRLDCMNRLCIVF